MIARHSYSAMSVATLKPREGIKHGVETKIEAPVHDSTASRRPIPRRQSARSRRRRVPRAREQALVPLPNGLQVVLLPVTSIPTVEMRLVFATGTAATSPRTAAVPRSSLRAPSSGRTGTSRLLNFAAAGATTSSTCRRYHRVRHPRPRHACRLLADRLARWVREGTYSSQALRELRALGREEATSRTRGAPRSTVRSTVHARRLARHI